MANVDPFVIRWPKKWESDPELRDVLRYLNRFLHDLWKRTGGGTDYIITNTENITNIETEVASELTSVSSGQLDDLSDTLEQIEDRIPISIVKEFYAAKKSAAYTAVDSDYIEANNRAIITLDPNADLNDQIIIANGDGSRIKVLGAIKYTRLDSSMFISNQGTSLHFQFFGDYWRIR
jgi:hypothetical protein